MTKVQSKDALLFDLVNDTGALRDGLVEAIGEVTTVDPGLISAADKAKLDGIAAGATANLGAYDTVADFDAANIPIFVQHVDIAGYYAPVDGGGHRKVRLGAAPSPVRAWHKQSGDGAWWLLASWRPTPKMFGAIGDGTTDDSVAVQDADGYAAFKNRTLYFDDGVYAVAELQMTAPWSMNNGAKLLYNGATGGECVRCVIDAHRFGDIEIDLNGREPRTGFYIAGNKNRFDFISSYNAVSTDQPWVVRTVYCAGNDNVSNDILLRDLVNTGNTNDSSPQGLVTHGTADRNEFIYVYGENCRSTVVNAASGTNTYGRIVSRLAKDNGFYSVAGTATVDHVVYAGDDNACGFRSGANVTIGTVHVISSASTSIFFGDCGNISIGDILIENGISAILHLNLAATGHIKIGSIRGNLTNTGPFAMPSGSGTVRSLSIGSIDLNVTITDLTNLSPSSWIELTACQELHLGDVKIKTILTGITGSGFFYANFPTTTYNSVVDTFRVYFYDSDGITLHPTRVFYARYVTAGKTLVREGVLDANASLRAANYSTFRPGQLVSGAAPTAGTWKRGTFVAVENPSASNLWGWVCVTGGTPGTWKATANLVA